MGHPATLPSFAREKCYFLQFQSLANAARSLLIPAIRVAYVTNWADLGYPRTVG
jgi:hypothetical protein